MLYIIEKTNEKMIKEQAFSMTLSGYFIAKNRSIETHNVARTEPTRPICKKPYLKFIKI